MQRVEEQRRQGERRRLRAVLGLGLRDTPTARSLRSRADLVALAAVAVLLLLWYVGLFVVRGLAFPVGPDAPVYLWWTRLASVDGLSAVTRPGVPAIALVVQGTLHLPLTAVLAALECGLGTMVGLVGAALARASAAPAERSDPAVRATTMLAGLLAGTFAVHLAAGYLATLAFAAMFLAAAVTLTIGTTDAAVGGAFLLGAGGLAHPLFLPLGVLILALAALLAWGSDRDEARRIAAASLGGGALLAAGELALLAGPGPPDVVTSRDGFLREAGLGDVLRTAYRSRFVHRWTRYVEWASVPLGILGLHSPRAFVRRFLLAWGIVLVAGVAVGLVTAWYPADRIITFGFALPVLSAFGVVRLWRALDSRWVRAAAAALVAAMLAGSLIAWARQDPFLSRTEVDAITSAGRYAAGAPPGTPLLFIVNDRDATATFLATRAANVIRAAVPPDRIRDVVVVVPPSPPDQATSQERMALARVTARQAAAATRSSSSSLSFVLLAFDKAADTAGMVRLSDQAYLEQTSFSGLVPDSVTHPVDPLEPSSPGQIALAAAAFLALVTVVGFGWSGTVAADPVVRLALAPACGTAALILLAVALERLGVPVTGWIGPTLVSALGGAGGYALAFLLERRAGAHPTDEVQGQPGQ